MKNNTQANFAVKLTNVSKKYFVHHEKPTFAEEVVKVKNEEFYALRDINLEIKKGEKIGVIGLNGSGKTTLLKILTGIALQSSGEVVTNGKVVSLIDLESGFQSDLTGIQNIFLNGMILGMSKKELIAKFRNIVKFADIGKFIDAPFYTYSSGMKLRLGFSIIANSNPDILLMDENISVGDKKFKERSFQKINEFASKGVTVIMATHNFSLLKKICKKGILLSSGVIKKSGSINSVLRAFNSNKP